MATTTRTGTLHFCDFCGGTHRADYSHEGEWGQGPIFAVICPEDPDALTDYYTAERVDLR